MMTIQDYYSILNLKEKLRLAHDQQFVRGVDANDFNLIKNVYQNSINDKADIWKINCGACVIDLFSRCYREILKFEYKFTESEIKSMIKKIQKNEIRK